MYYGIDGKLSFIEVITQNKTQMTNNNVCKLLYQNFSSEDKNKKRVNISIF